MNNLSVVDVSWNTPIGKMRGRIGPYGLEYLGLPLGFKQIPTGDSGPEVPVAVVGTEIRGIQSPGRRQQQCLNLTTQFLEYYFRGDKSCELPELDWSKWGGFYRRVWTETRKVRFGRTRTYGEIAEAAGRPGSARAVGGGNAPEPDRSDHTLSPDSRKITKRTAQPDRLYGQPWPETTTFDA